MLICQTRIDDGSHETFLRNVLLSSAIANQTSLEVYNSDSTTTEDTNSVNCKTQDLEFPLSSSIWKLYLRSKIYISFPIKE